MPDVTISNPTVQIDLSAGSSTTVPSGVQWRVTLATDGLDGQAKLNGEKILYADAGGSRRSAIEIDLFGGDTIKADNRQLRIRGYRVD